MKKQLLTTALAAVAMLFGSVAFAAATSTTVDANYPLVASGGTVVMEDQIVTDGAGGDLDIDDKVVLTLPAGVNFVGTPTATTSNAAGTLKLSSNTLGDPGDTGLVTLTDTNGDGGMDRAEITVRVAGTAGDVMVFRGSITYVGTSSTGNLTPTVSVFDKSANLFSLVDTNNVLATKTTSAKTATPIALQSSSTVYTLPNSTASAVANAVSYLVTVPSGKGSASTNDNITFTFGTGIKIDATTAATITPLTDNAPALVWVGAPNPGNEGTTSLTTTLSAATTRESQYLVAFNVFDTVGQTLPTTVNVTLSGDAGVAGSAVVASLAATGSTTKLTGVAPVKATLVRGADALQTLPTFEITEIFPADFTAANTITIVPPTGVTLVGAGAAAGAGTYGTAIAGNKLTITLTAVAGAKETITISGVTAKASSTAGDDILLTVGSSITGEEPNAPFTTLSVASAVNLGTVTVAGPTTKGTVGRGTAGNAGTISLSESTYGAINTNSTFPYIRIAASSGVTITGVVATPQSTLTFGTPVASVPADGSWTVPVTAESSTKISATTPATLVVTYSVSATATIGADVTFTLTSDTNVSGSAAVATISNTTTNSVTANTAITSGTTGVNPVSLANLNIKETYAAALTNTGQLRIIAPTGITFADPGLNAPTSVAGLGTFTVGSTFAANDTLVAVVTSTGAVDTLTVSPKVYISSNAAAGLATFSIVDGNLTNGNKSAVTASSVALYYVGTVAALNGGADATVNIGFPLVRSVTGGLAPYTATSSATATATVAVSGSTVTVTGVSTGSAVVTVKDALGNSDTVAITVATGATPPALTTTTGSGATTTAVIGGGITGDNGTTFGSTFSVGNAISIIASITPETAQIGESADVIVVVQAGSSYLMVASDSIAPWDGNPANLAKFSTITLAASNTIDITAAYPGGLTLSSAEVGTYSIFVGYKLASGEIYYNSTPISLTVN
jgi:hypothetical protein